jgi:hypothetical protein
MNKSEKRAIVASKTDLRVPSFEGKILPFDDGSKRMIMKKEP